MAGLDVRQMYALVSGPMWIPIYLTLTPTPVKHFWMLINRMCLSYGNSKLAVTNQSRLKSPQVGTLDAMILKFYGSCKITKWRLYSALRLDWKTLPHIVDALWIAWYRKVTVTWLCMDKRCLGKSPSSICVTLKDWWAISYHLKDMTSGIIMPHMLYMYQRYTMYWRATTYDEII